MHKIYKTILHCIPFFIILTIILVLKNIDIDIDIIFTLLTLIASIINNFLEDKTQEKTQNTINCHAQKVFSKFAERIEYYSGISLVIVSILVILYNLYTINSCKIWLDYLLISIGGFVLIFYAIIKEVYLNSENSLENKVSPCIINSILLVIYIVIKFIN